MGTVNYPGHGAELDAKNIRKALDREEWQETEHDDSCEQRRLFLGSVFTLTPSGKFYTPFACSNVRGCDSCKGHGFVLTTKKRTHKKWVHRQERSRRHYMNPRRVVVFLYPDRRETKIAKQLRIFKNYARTMRSCTACGGTGSREAHLDEKWNEYAEALCESIGISFEADDGDYFAVEYRDTPENEDDGDVEEENESAVLHP